MINLELVTRLKNISKIRSLAIWLVVPFVMLTVSFYAPVLSTFILELDVWEKALKYSWDSLFWHSLGVTVKISSMTAIVCVLFALPVSIFMSLASPFEERLTLALLFSSLFSSLLLKSFTWYVLLGRNGPVVGVIEYFLGVQPKLLFNEIGLVIGMSHILIPTAAIAMWASFRLGSRDDRRLSKLLGSSETFHLVRILLNKNFEDNRKTAQKDEASSMIDYFCGYGHECSYSPGSKVQTF